MSKKKYVIAFVGPVGSGKTYIARILSRELGALHINTDAIRVRLRRQGKPISRAIAIAKRKWKKGLLGGRSVIVDFDAVRPEKQHELRRVARRFGTRFFLIKIETPEKLLLKRLREKRYTRNDLFQNAKEATRVYFIRSKFHQKKQKLQRRPDFVINNARPLGPQIKKILKKLKGL